MNACFHSQISLIALSFYGLSLSAQVQIDHRIELTGSGDQGKITGVQTADSPSDAPAVGMIQNNQFLFSEASLSGSVYSISITPAISALQTGQIFHFRANAANTGAVTLSVNSLPGIPITKNFNQALAENDIRQGQLVSVMYDGANNLFQMLSQLGQQSSGGIQDIGIFQPVSCVSDLSTITWGNFYPGAAAAGYELKNCLPRRLGGQSNDFGWLFLGVVTSGCAGGSLSGIYTPAATSTWTSAIASQAGPRSWFILNNRTVDIVCFK